MGISVNNPEANRRFAQALGLEFPLLCDVTKEVSRQYGVLGFFPRLARRATFVVDPYGIIRRIERGREALSPAGVLQACRAIQTSLARRES